ncbi:MAG: hypothetical protein ACOYMA_08190 [Bacteroidia bacterium]
MKLTLNIPESSKEKAISLIKFLNTLDYLTIESSDDLSIYDWQKDKVRERIKTSKEVDFSNWDDVKLQFNL